MFPDAIQGPTLHTELLKGNRFFFSFLHRRSEEMGDAIQVSTVSMQMDSVVTYGDGGGKRRYRFTGEN